MLFETIQLCSPKLLVKVREYADKRGNVDIFNNYVTAVMEMKRFYAAVREYRMSIREGELLNHPELVTSLDADFDRDRKLLSCSNVR